MAHILEFKSVELFRLTNLKHKGHKFLESKKDFIYSKSEFNFVF